MIFSEMKLYIKHSLNDLKKASKQKNKTIFHSRSSSLERQSRLKESFYEQIVIDEDMICQYSGLPSLKSYRKTDI